MKKKIRYAAVGLGHISQTAVLPAFKHAENSEFRGMRRLCAAPEKKDGQNRNEDHEEPNQIKCNTIRPFKFPSSPHLNPSYARKVIN